MNDVKNGYEMPKYDQPTKRYCQTLNLKSSPELKEEYKKRHSPEYYWQEIGDGIREVGILNMEIFWLGDTLFMIVETPLDFEWESAFAKLATLPRQSEWEEYMSVFQDAEPGASSDEKWKLMERIFAL